MVRLLDYPCPSRDLWPHQPACSGAAEHWREHGRGIQDFNLRPQSPTQSDLVSSGNTLDHRVLVYTCCSVPKGLKAFNARESFWRVPVSWRLPNRLTAAWPMQRWRICNDMQRHETAAHNLSLLIGPGIPRRTPSAARLPVQQASAWMLC